MDVLWILIVVFAAVAVPYGCRVLKRRIISGVYADVERKEFDRCFETMDKAWCRIALSGFESMLLRLDISIKSDSPEKVGQCMDKLDSMRMNKARREQILYMAMTYYVENGNRERCERVLDRLENIQSVTAYNEAQKLYHIFVLKDGEYIKEMEEAFNQTEDKEGKLAIASFLIMQYENTGDNESADKYKEITEQLKREQ